MTEDLRRARLRTWILVAGCFAVLAGTMVVAQVSSTTPLNPVNFTSQTAGPVYVWGAGVYGTDTSSVSGNNTVYGTTLMLNAITSGQGAVANYEISFPSLKDLTGYVDNFTLYVPDSLVTASNATPFSVRVGDQLFEYQPTAPEKVPWWPTPIYAPANSTVVSSPGPFTTGPPYQYIPFNFHSSTLAQNETIRVSIIAPPNAQIYIPNIVLTASFYANSYDTATSEKVALATLPAFGAALVGIYFLLRKFSAGRYLGTLAAAFSLQVVLAPFFLHSDLVTLVRYDLLYFNYGLVNLQPWTYGLLWFGTIVLPPAPVYLAGVSPSVTEWDLLLKLPAIVADLLTFLVLVRILSPRLGERKAYGIATAGWLFNPLVVYISAVHGLGESVVALFVTLTAYFLLNRRFWLSTAGAVGSVLSILPTGLVAIPMFLSRRLSWWQRLALVISPVAAYVLVFLALYHSTAGLVTYLVDLVRRTNFENLSLGAASRSRMTYLFLLDQWFGVYVSPALGAALVVAACGVLLLRNRELFPSHTLLALYGTLLAFYLTYEVFYVQHWVWAIPLFVSLVVLVPRIGAFRGTAFVAVVSVLALAINFVSYNDVYLAAVLSFVLFTWFVVPLVLWIPAEILRPRSAEAISLVARIAGVGFALSLVVDDFSGAHLPWMLVTTAAIVGLAFLFLAGLPARPVSALRSMAARGSASVAIVGSLIVAYEATTPLPPAELVATCGLVTMAMAELARWTVGTLLTATRAPAPPAALAPTEISEGTPRET